MNAGEEAADVSLQWLEELRSDLRLAARQLIAAPAFTLVAALTLALGIGVNSAIFALADAAGRS